VQEEPEYGQDLCGLGDKLSRVQESAEDCGKCGPPMDVRCHGESMLERVHIRSEALGLKPDASFARQSQSW
jgi:hypothetical protein